MNIVVLQGFACETIYLIKSFSFYPQRLQHININYIFSSYVTWKLVNHISSFMKHTLKNSITYYLVESFA